MLKNKLIWIIGILLLVNLSYAQVDYTVNDKASCCSGTCLDRLESKDGYAKPVDSYSCSVGVCKGSGNRWWCASGCELTQKQCGIVCGKDLGQCKNSNQECVDNVCVTKEIIISEQEVIEQEGIQSDFDNDGKVDQDDLFEFFTSFGGREGDNKYKEEHDFNSDNKVDFSDFLDFTKDYGKSTVQLDPVQPPVVNQRVIDCNVNPNECFSIEGASRKVKNNVDSKIFNKETLNCGNLKKGEKCEVQWNVKLDKDSGVNSKVPLNIDFSYNNRGENIITNLKTFLKPSLNGISGGLALVSGSFVNEITGFVVSDNQNNNKFNCILTNNPQLCCPSPYFKVSESDPTQCIKSDFTPKPAVTKENIRRLITEKMRRYLEASAEERIVLREDLLGLERQLDSLLQ